MDRKSLDKIDLDTISIDISRKAKELGIKSEDDIEEIVDSLRE